MNQHRYILEPYKGMNTRHHCPEQTCKGKNFVLYIDTETGQYIAPTVGRCNRESNCGYHYTPKQYFQDNNTSFNTPHLQTYTQPKAIKPPSKPASFIDAAILKASLKGYKENHFIKFLIGKFGEVVTSELISRYFIGSSKHWPGATVFWQIDRQGKIRTGKIMLYSPTTGKRIKEPYSHITWVHTATKQPDFELEQCLFGEHLLQDKSKSVAIVESEKTAIIASVYIPQFIWLAVGSITNLNADKCRILKGRNVILYPDLKGFDKWSIKGKEISHITSFKVSELLESNATDTEKKQGLDLADYLLRLPVPIPKEQETEQQNILPSKQAPELLPVITLPSIEPLTNDEWLQQIAAEAIHNYTTRYSPANIPPEKYFKAYGQSIGSLLAAHNTPLQSFLNATTV